jgi:creatinine amidohydrolase
MKLLVEEMTRDEAHEAYAQGAMVVLPTGSIEQHGPHLPVMVDTLAVTHVARGAGAVAAQRVPLVVAPTWQFGVSHHHLAFSGTMSLTSHIYIEGLKELVRCLYRHGVRKVFLLNGHGGNQNPNGTVVQALVHEEGLDMAIGSASYWQTAAKALADAGANDVAPRFPGHAGGFETSVTLALRPDLVQLDKRRAPLGSLEGQGFGTEHGVFQRAGGTSDDASRADAEIGKRLVEAAVQATAETFVTFFERTRRPAEQPV